MGAATSNPAVPPDSRRQEEAGNLPEGVGTMVSGEGEEDRATIENAMQSTMVSHHIRLPDHQNLHSTDVALPRPESRNRLARGRSGEYRYPVEGRRRRLETPPVGATAQFNRHYASASLGIML